MANRFHQRQLCWALLSSALLLITPVACSANHPSLAINGIDLANLEAEDIQRLLNSDVVYLGEQHDSEADHAAQLEIIEFMYAENPDIAIAFEMFQRPFQPVLDRYLAGEISEAELVTQSEYEQRWGFPWEFYAPFLRFAQENQLPVLALNAPSEITRQVAREGLDSLEGDDFRYIPPLSDIDTSNADYQAFVQEAFASHGSHGNFNFDNFFAAQVIWDETMAETIADFKQTSPDTLVIVLAGKGHVMYGYGIPDRVARRLGDSLQQTKVLLNFPEEFLTDSPDEMADIFWYSE
ncbi:MAG: ChaN family lipoprotein [Leptolyngbya sp. SIO1D8]|nr:ChaN family lipoprotein [Leptolyngbya sp. SIO1D8]